MRGQSIRKSGILDQEGRTAAGGGGGAGRGGGSTGALPHQVTTLCQQPRRIYIESGGQDSAGARPALQHRTTNVVTNVIITMKTELSSALNIVYK